MAGKSPIKKRLKEARLEIGLSQKQLGIAAGIDSFVASARLNQYETGKHSPNFDMVKKIAKILKVPTAYFYTDDDSLAELIKLYDQLNETNQQKLLKKIKMMVK